MIWGNYRERRAVVQGNHTDILLAKPLQGLTNGIFIGLVLLKALGLHKVPEIAVVIEVLHVHIQHIGTFQGLTRLKGFFQYTAGFEIAQLNPIKCLTLARFYKLIFQNRAGIPVKHHF